MTKLKSGSHSKDIVRPKVKKNYTNIAKANDCNIEGAIKITPPNLRHSGQGVFSKNAQSHTFDSSHIKNVSVPKP